MNTPTEEDAAKKAQRDKADREKLTALGYDADNPAVLERFQNLSAKVEEKTITMNDALRDMDKQAYEMGDKERRDAAREQKNSQQEEQKKQYQREM